jgi:hypothetical protein
MPSFLNTTYTFSTNLCNVLNFEATRSSKVIYKIYLITGNRHTLIQNHSLSLSNPKRTSEALSLFSCTI